MNHDYLHVVTMSLQYLFLYAAIKRIQREARRQFGGTAPVFVLLHLLPLSKWHWGSYYRHITMYRLPPLWYYVGAFAWSQTYHLTERPISSLSVELAYWPLCVCVSSYCTYTIFCFRDITTFTVYMEFKVMSNQLSAWSTVICLL